MTTNQLLTAGAVAFAGFALWYITRKPGGQVAQQPGQRARDAGLQTWLDQRDAQAREIEGGAYALSLSQFQSMLGKAPK